MLTTGLRSEPLTLIYAPFTASILGMLLVVLSVRVIKARRSAQVAIGSAGNALLERRMRAQANFCEYVPFALLLLLVGELVGIDKWFLGLASVVLILGRCLHAYGISQEQEELKYRVSGMAMTFTVILGLSVRLMLYLLVAST